MQQILETYRPNKQKYVLFLVACIVFAAIGVRMASTPDSPSDDIFMLWHRPIGCVGTVVAGAFGIMAVLQLLPGSLRLEARPDGLAIRTKWLTTNFYRWSDIEKFGVAEFTLRPVGSLYFKPTISSRPITKGHSAEGVHFRRVGFNFSGNYSGGGLAWKYRDYNQSHYGFDGLLPDTYGMDCETLAARLNQLKEQHA